MNSKGNLLKHLQNLHGKLLREHKEERCKNQKKQQTLEKDCTLAKQSNKESFKNQDKIVTSIVKNLCGL